LGSSRVWRNKTSIRATSDGLRDEFVECGISIREINQFGLAQK
jgi:hypothetical protein